MCYDMLGRFLREANVISTGKLRCRFEGSSGTRNGSKAIRWTANASLPVPLTAIGSRSASPPDLVAFVRAKGGLP